MILQVNIIWGPHKTALWWGRRLDSPAGNLHKHVLKFLILKKYVPISILLSALGSYQNECGIHEKINRTSMLLPLCRGEIHGRQLRNNAKLTQPRASTNIYANSTIQYYVELINNKLPYISYHISYHIISYHIISYHIISYHIILNLFILIRTKSYFINSHLFFIYFLKIFLVHNFLVMNILHFSNKRLSIMTWYSKYYKNNTKENSFLSF